MRVNRHAEGRVAPRGVVADLERNLELIEPIGHHGEANEPAAVSRHEVDGVWRDAIGGHREVAFVLAVLIVHDDDHLARGNRRDGAFDAREGRRTR